ncbi:hypothetical protein [Myxococcus sp. RHSTA-1-4]|uniref:hypothetical protein n=1 Tax=Myxococcus sp. RHSTA-1-4 TaxID=2874601 RepID=UPI001CBD4BF2|nr:hypothetical protein [Myxococcus sp. RHSTA-1-4]MBZ4422031.1 hypothetical protein [Myxococcus sp. RHSTA-1-4]
MTCPQPPRRPYRPQREDLDAHPPARKLRRGAVLRDLASRPGPWGALLALVMLLAGTALLHVEPSPELEHAAVELLDAGEPDAGVVVDVHQDQAGSLRAQRIPEKPDPRWERAPCPGGYVEVRGTCWARLDNRPPCPVATYEHAGRCYVPLLKAPKLPNSISE